MSFKEIKLEDFTLHCRTCLIKITDVKHGILEMTISMLKLFKQLTGYKKSQKKCYPDGVCDQCFLLLKSFSEFQALSLKSKLFLENAIKVSNTSSLKIQPEDNGELDKIDINECLTAEDPLESMDLILKCEPEFLPDDNEDKINDILSSNEKETNRYEIIEGMDESDDELLINLKEKKEIETATKIKEINEMKLSNLISKGENESEQLTSSQGSICTICGKKLSSASSLKKHMRIHQDKRPFPCSVDQCNAAFNRRYELKKHMEIHSDVPLQFPCKFGCGIVFNRSRTAEKHYHRKHSIEYKNSKIKPSEILSYICEDCGKVSKNLRSFKDHRNRHLPIEERPFQCEQCNKRFSAQTELKDHLMRHNGIKNFQCPHCDVKTVTRRELRFHISNIHTKEMRVDCELCKRTFGNRAALLRHIKVIHQGIKSYQCKYCDRAFGASEHLKHHERTHTGEKPYKCNKCGKSFIQPTALRVHKKIHERRNS